MPFLHLTTFIAANPETIFDLSRSIDLHKASMSTYSETVINGRINGLLEKGETVTWKAKHLMKERIMTIVMNEVKFPEYFVDEQKNGPFKKMKHEHYFKKIQNGTIMIDQFTYEIKSGIVGRLINKLFLQRYITRLLNKRNQFIKETAEGNAWKKFLNK